jgi:hypothetical protein
MRLGAARLVIKLWCKSYVAEYSSIFGFCTMKKIGYARVSTDAQETRLQMDALERAKCARSMKKRLPGPKPNGPS